MKISRKVIKANQVGILLKRQRIGSPHVLGQVRVVGRWGRHRLPVLVVVVRRHRVAVGLVRRHPVAVRSALVVPVDLEFGHSRVGSLESGISKITSRNHKLSYLTTNHEHQHSQGSTNFFRTDS